MTKKSNRNNKSKTVFDHVNHIRKIQDKSYYSNLSETDKRTFNCYMILRILSMDNTNIEMISIVSKYLDILSPNEFYLLLINLLPKSNKYHKYIKSSVENIDTKIIECICNLFEIGKRDAIDYYNTIMSMENGNIEIKRILNKFGYN